MDTETLLDHLEDALFQAGDGRRGTGGEVQIGHLCIPTWRNIWKLLVAAGRLEPVGNGEYWARKARRAA